MSPALRGAVAGCVLGVALGWNVGNLGGVASDLAGTYGVGLAAIGFLTTALFVTHAGVQIPAGRASDRLGPLGVAVVAAVLVCVGDLVAMAGGHLALGIAGRAVTGLGTGVAFIAALALVRGSGGGPLAQGLYGGTTSGGGGLAIAVVPALIGPLGWRAPYISSLVLCVAATAIVLALRPRTAPVAERPAGGVPLGSILRDRRLVRLAVVFSASFGLSIVIGAWVAELLERHSDLTAGQAATVGALTLVLSIISRPAGGWIVRARPERTRAAIAASLVAGAAGTLLLLAAESAEPAIAGGILVGVGAGIPFAPCIAAVAATRPDAPATAIGVVNGAAIVLILVGTPLAGVTFAMAGDGRIGFAVMAALWIAALAGLPSRTP